MSFDLPPDWGKHVAGPVGSMIGLYWLKGGGWAKAVGFVTGCTSSVFGAPSLAAFSGMDHGLSGFLLGMFGFSIISKGFETIQRLKPWVAVASWIEKKPGGES